MKHINRLIMQLKQAQNGSDMHLMAFVEYNEAKRMYIAKVNKWNGIPGTGCECMKEEHENQEEAVAACDKVAACYPGCEYILFIEDFGE